MNNQFNFQNMFQTPMVFKTKQSTKIAITFLLGISPMMLAWFLFRAPLDNWAYDSMLARMKTAVELGYGWMWLIALGALALTVILTFIAIKYDKNVKPDVFIPTVTIAFGIMNFYLFPQIGGWRLLTFIPMIMLGGMIAKIILVIYIIYNFQKNFDNMKDQFTNMFGGGGNTPFGNFGGRGGNPFQQQTPPTNNQEEIDTSKVEDVVEKKEDSE